jgi:hypothetical protein
VLVLASVEQILTDVQGPGPVDVLGDMILVLDSNLQVTWAWNSFDHLDTSRQAILGETCGLGAGGCAPFYLASTANDWTHGNALQLGQWPDPVEDGSGRGFCDQLERPEPVVLAPA